MKELTHIKEKKRTLLKFVVYGVLLSVAIVIALFPFILNKPIVPKRLRVERYPADLKYVLIWKPQKDRPFETGQKHFIEQKCRYINCYLTSNRSLLNGDHRNFDAVIFHAKDVSKDKDDYNIRRFPHQKFVFRSLDPTDKYPVCDPIFENFFNWTWTYKLNSDIPQPAFNVYDVSHKRVGPKKDMNWTQPMRHSDSFMKKINTKTKAVAWVVPKCSTKGNRQETVSIIAEELQSYNYSVDIYGACAPNKCPDHKLWKCFQMLEKDYFFHLIMEDYMSEDYVSDHVMKTMNHFTFPLIFGGADYDRFLPPGSYIDLQAIDIKKLGAILDFLMKNPDKYSYLFDWKNHYYMTERPKSRICELCTALNLKVAMEEQAAHDNFRSWWNPDFRDYCKPWVLEKNNGL